MMRTAVVILNYNGAALLLQFLPTVLANSAGAEVVVADNGSTDNSLEILQQFSDVRVIALPSNGGFCAGYNQALREVQADVYVLLNSDVEVTPNWLDGPLRLFEAGDVHAVQPKILAHTKRAYFEYAGAGGGFIDFLGYPFCRGRLFQHIERDTDQYNDIRPVFWASGACLFIRASTFHRFGGFDESFFAHMEEIDLCWKIQRAQGKVMYCGESTVYHVGAGTLSYESPRKTFLNFRNNLALVSKHWTASELIWKLPLRFVLDWTAAMSFVVRGSFANAWQVINAQLHFIGRLGLIIKKRKKVKAIDSDYPRTEVYHRSVVAEFFIRGKKTIKF